MRIVKGDLILTKNTVFETAITVEGNIRCEGGRWNLTVNGNIDAQNIHAWNIDAWDIDARNIHAGNIDAWDIDARDIDARDIVCNKLTLKNGGKAVAYSLFEDRFKRQKKVLKEAVK